MSRSSARSLPSFCLNRVIASRMKSKCNSVPPIGAASEARDDADDHQACTKPNEHSNSSSMAQDKAVEIGRKVMVVMDGSQEARTALHWALSHSVRACDTVVLLDVVKPCKIGDEQLGQKDRDPKGYQLLEAMKSICQAKIPEVHVELCLVEGRERGPTIVEAARKQGVSLLVMGQRKHSITWRLLVMWMGGDKATGGGGTVEYCVQNAACMALAVRRKSRRGGGYLVTTRRHRDFWLLA